MASNSNLLHITECAVCLLKYKLPERIPKILECGHTFCICCLGELETDRSIKCPTCRACQDIPDNGVQSLTSNHVIISLLEELCEECNEETKAEKCTHCDKNLCNTCILQHTNDLAENAKQALSELGIAISGIRDINTEYDVIVQTVQDQCHDMRDQIMRDTSAHIHEMRNKLEAHQQKQTFGCHRIDEMQRTTITGILTKHQNNQECLKGWADLLCTMTNTLDNDKMPIRRLTDLTREIKELKQEVESFPSIDNVMDITLPDISAEYRQSISATSPGLEQPDVTHPDSSPTDVEGHTLPKRNLSYRLGRNITISNTLSYYRTIGKPRYIISGVRPQPTSGGYVHIALSELDGTLFVADYGGGCILRINDQGQHLSSFWYDEQELYRKRYRPELVPTNASCPRGVNVDHSGNVAVAAEHCVLFFEHDGTIIRKLGEHGSNHGNFNSPYGVIYGDNKELFIVDWHNNRVQVMDADRTWTVHSVFRQKPKGVTICQDGTVLVVTEGTKPEMWAISPDGSKRQIYVADAGIPRDNDKGFSQMIIDKDGYILLADEGGHCILVLDMNGIIHCKIGEKGTLPGLFSDPAGLALTKDGRLVVSEFENRRIQLF